MSSSDKSSGSATAAGFSGAGVRGARGTGLLGFFGGAGPGELLADPSRDGLLRGGAGRAGLVKSPADLERLWRDVGTGGDEADEIFLRGGGRKRPPPPPPFSGVVGRGDTNARVVCVGRALGTAMGGSSPASLNSPPRRRCGLSMSAKSSSRLGGVSLLSSMRLFSPEMNGDISSLARFSPRSEATAAF